MTSQSIVTLDVREDIQKGREPFSRIMESVSRLENGQQLRLLVPFEPIPLLNLMGRRGFSHVAMRTEEGDWEVVFARGSDGNSPGLSPDPGHVEKAGSPAIPPRSNGPFLEVDARGLEPPQPLVTILEALSCLPNGGELLARTDRRPIHLYSHLQERGFTGDTREQYDGSFVTTIRRA